MSTPRYHLSKSYKMSLKNQSKRKEIQRNTKRNTMKIQRETIDFSSTFNDILYDFER